MIHFFRRIRKGMVNRERVGKYLLYAVGEILLVVIGILIALQVNNWNEQSKEGRVELTLYLNIFDDLKTGHDDLERYIGFSRYLDTAITDIYNQSSGRSELNESKLLNILSSNFRYSTFFREKYLASLGDVQNERLHNAMKLLISHEIATEKSVEEYNNYISGTVRPYLSENGINNTDSMFNERVDNFGFLITQTNMINYQKLKEQYGSTELHQILYNLRYNNLWIAQNLLWLQTSNLRRCQLLFSYELSKTELSGTFEPITPQSEEEEKWLNEMIQESKPAN